MSAAPARLQQHALVVILALGLAARLGVAAYLGNSVTPLPGIADQLSYHLLATRVSEGHGFSFPTDWWPDARANTPTAFWSYLYTLYLAAAYRLVGVVPAVPRLLQAALVGVSLPWLAYRIGRQVFNPTVGRLSAAWVSGYGYFIYYSAALMTEMFYIVGVLWVLDCGLRLSRLDDRAGTRQRRWRPWLELGLAIGLTALLRQVILAFVPVLILWIFWVRAGQRPAGVPIRRSVAGWAAGLLVCGLSAGAVILPVTVHNYRQFGSFVPINSNSGFAFFWANHPVYGDRFVGILDETGPGYSELIPPELRHLGEAALDRALLRRGLGFVVDDPGRYLRLSLSRIPVYFMFWPSSASSLLSNIVRVASFGMALPFMLGGLVVWGLAAARGRLTPATRTGGMLLLTFVVVYSLVHLLSWSLIRYRLPVDAVLLIFSAHALAVLWQWLRLRLPRSAGRVEPAPV